MKKFLKVKSKHNNNILSYEGVNSVGIGYKIVNGKKTSELAILVFVTSKKPLSGLDKSQIIPQKIDSVPTDIIEMAPLQYLVLPADETKDTPSNQDHGRYRPLVGGIQLYLNDKTGAWYGTLGTFVKSQDNEDQSMYLLSNLHVLKSVGLAVYQSNKGNSNLIGATSFAQEFENTDAALAVLDNPSDVAVNTIQDMGIVNETKDVDITDLDKDVMKRGRTTLLTTGIVFAIDVTLEINGKTCTECVMVSAEAGKAFVQPGDSGSPVVLKEDNKLTGLLFAGNKSGEIGVFCKIGNVFENLNIKLG
jgi:endonuclease G